MSNNEYSRQLVTGFIAHVEGEVLVIEGANFLPQNVDYKDDNSVKMLAASAIHTADGFYDLVKRNCYTTNPDISYGAHLEMYLALSGLACEIYMKAIIYHESLHNGEQVRVHYLDELFSKLPLATQEAIVSNISNIAMILPAIRDIFIILRYDFEKNHIQGDYLVIFELMEELRIIAHKYPEINLGAIKCTKGTLLLE